MVILGVKEFIYKIKHFLLRRNDQSGHKEFGFTNLKEYINFKKSFLPYLTILFLLVAIGVTINQVQRQQELKSKAAFYPNGVVLTLSSSKTTLTPNEEITVDILIDTKNLTVSAVDVNIVFPSSTLQILELKNGSFLSNELLAGTISQANGTARIVLSSGSPLGTVAQQPKKGTGILATMRVRALQLSSVATINFDPLLTKASAIEAQRDPTIPGSKAPNVIGGLNPITFNIVSGPTPTPTPTTIPSPTSTKAPTPTPTPGCPASPVLVSPVNNTNLSCGYKSITLSWSKPTFATRYGVRVDDGINDIKDSRNNCSPYAVCIDDYVGNSITINLVSGRSYRWWIHASNLSCPYSAAYTFNFSVAVCPTPSPTFTPTPTRTPTPSPTPSQYRITGNVYLDTNWNNVKDSGESNFANASLYIYGTYNGVYQKFPQPNSINGVVKTDALGNYSLQVPTTGTYYIYLTLPTGYVVQSSPTSTTSRTSIVISSTSTVKDFPVIVKPTGTMTADPCIGTAGTTIRWRYTNAPSAVVCRGSKVFASGPADTDNSVFAPFVSSTTSATLYLKAPYLPLKADCSGSVTLKTLNARCAVPISCTVSSTPMSSTSFKGITTITYKAPTTVNSIRWYLDGVYKGTTSSTVPEFIFSNLVTGSLHYLRSAVVYYTNQVVYCPTTQVIVQ